MKYRIEQRKNVGNDKAMELKRILDLQRNISVEIEKLSNRPFYAMNYYGDDFYNQYLMWGAHSMEEYCSFIENMLIQNNNKQMPYDGFGCSAFVAQNENGDILLARNMDCEYAIPMLLHLNNEASNKSLSLVNMSVLDWDETTYDTLEEDPKLTLATAYSPYDGMNEYGLAVAILTDATAIYTNDSNKTTLFDMTLTRLLLDKAKTVDEAINYVKEYNLFCDFAPLHYIVADSTGDAAVIEFVDGNMVITKKKERYLIVSNFTLYNNPSKEGFGKDRYENYQNALAKCGGIISEADALELLKSNVIPGDEQWSAVYNLTKRTMWVTFFGEYERVYCNCVPEHSSISSD